MTIKEAVATIEVEIERLNVLSAKRRDRIESLRDVLNRYEEAQSEAGELRDELADLESTLVSQAQETAHAR